MKALVTRPSEDAGTVAAALEARGIEPLLEPLLSIRFAADGAARLAPLLPGVQAALFTSVNGVRAFAQASAGRSLPAFAVGDATAQAARAAGFGDVVSAGGNVEDLARLVIERLSPAGGALLHAAAGAVAGDLAGRLAGAGFEVRRAILYEAVPASSFTAETQRALAAGEIGLALFFSPRTAATFVRLAAGAGLEPQCRRIAAIALSPAVASAAGAMPWRTVRTADVPQMGAMLDALDGLATGRETGGDGPGKTWPDQRQKVAR